MSSKPTKKASAPAGKDIRSFFGGGSSQTQPSQSKATQQSIPSSQPSQPLKKSATSSNLKRKAEEEDGDVKLPPKKKATSKAIEISEDEDMPTRVPKKRSQVLISSDEEEPVLKKTAPKPRASTSKEQPPKPAAPTTKRKKPVALLSSDDEEIPPPPRKKPAPEKKAPSAKTKKADGFVKTSKKQDEEYSVASDDDDDLVGPSKAKGKKPAPKKKPAKEEKGDEPPKKKFNYYAHQAAKSAAPAAHGSKAVPDGDHDCLAGLSFVFTGELSSFTRDEAVDTAKRFGGRVVGQPSTRTDYVVLGDNAGPSKLAAIKKHGIRTLDEDAFLNLIATRKGSGVVDEKTKKKMEKEQAAIKTAAKEMEKREQAEAKSSAAGNGKTVDPSMQLWTSRYAPQSLKEVCGNKSAVEKLLLWLQEWQESYKGGFKKAGKNAMNTHRAVLITGSPGIGKTTSAHLCAKLAGYTPIEMNASDSRSKKLVESGMNINNTSLDGFFGGSKPNSLGVDITDKTCLIMDEVDGMSAGDRGGVGALNAMIRKTKIPIICIANDRGAQKLKPLQSTTFSLTFSKPPVTQIRSRILTIAFKEKMQLPANVIDQLISGSQSDIRQVLNMLSTWKLSSSTMSFDEGKDLTKMNEKHQILSPFDITSKMLGPYLFSPNEKKPLGDKMELYFQDHSFVPLFMQENYLKGHPSALRNLDGPELALRHLELMDKAAASISDGDLVDSMIHGPEQHWSLMPLHAICSTVRPASHMYGQGPQWGYAANSLSFPQWLGQNSKQNKLNRQLSDVQIKMRMRVSGDKHEIRQQYIPALFPQIVRPLMEDGQAAVEDVIERMDKYYLSKEDWDSIVELGVDTHRDDTVLKKIPGPVKSAFTRKYNSSEHPIAYHKGDNLGKVPKRLGTVGEKPDLEDAFDMDDDVAVSDDEDSKKGKGSGSDVENDKFIKAAKKVKKSVKAK